MDALALLQILDEADFLRSEELDKNVLRAPGWVTCARDLGAQGCYLWPRRNPHRDLQ
jgi:hypothetical protein